MNVRMCGSYFRRIRKELVWRNGYMDKIAKKCSWFKWDHECNNSEIWYRRQYRVNLRAAGELELELGL